MRSLRKLFGISWMSRTPNTVLRTMFMMLRQRILGHVRRMKEGRIPIDILYGELTTEKRIQLRYRDVCGRDMEEPSVDENEWEELAIYRSSWRSYLQATLNVAEKIIMTALENKSRLKKETLKTAILVVSIHNHS